MTSGMGKTGSGQDVHVFAIQTYMMMNNEQSQQLGLQWHLDS